MSTTLGILALVLLGADGAPKEAAPQICYEFRVLEMTGVGWREGVYSSLQPVTRQGCATVWTTTNAVAAALVKKADQVVTAPKVTSFSDAPAHVSTKVSRGVVTHLSRQADGPVNHATKVAYSPETERIRDGFATTVAGRQLDQGVLIKLVLDDTQVTAVHPVYLTEFQEPKAGDHQQVRWDQVQVKLEVPEVSHTELAGEWLVPTDGVLLASLGAHCVADAKGKAVVRERLVLVKAEAILEPVAVGLAPQRGPVPAALPNPPMPAPSAPSRTLPQGLNAEGEAVPLPPLPPEGPAPTARPDSSEPVATPQTKHAPGAGPNSKEGADQPPVPPPHEDAKPAAEPEVRKTSLPADDPRYAPLGPDVPWPLDRTGRARTSAKAQGHAECCEAPPARVAPAGDPLPEGADPLPEAAIPPPPAEAAACPDDDLRQTIVGLIQAAERLKMAGDSWDRFWTADRPMPPVSTLRGDDGAQAPPPPVQAYELRWPLTGVDVEVRIVPRRGAEPTNRATWRPSGQGDSTKR